MKYLYPVSGLSSLILGVFLSASSVQAAAVPALIAPGGVSDFGTVANSAQVRLNGTMTLEAWLYPTAWRSYSGREKHGLNFMYKGRIGSHIDYVFALQENGILCLGNTHGYIGVLDKRIPLNQWTHVAVSVNESTGSLVFYINGENCGAGSGWQGASLDRYSFLGPSDHPLYVGGFNQMGWGYNNDNFIGKIADVRMWNIVRTPAEIAANYQKQLKGNEAGLGAYWNFTDRLDKSPNGNHMTLTGAAAFQTGRGPDLQGAGGIAVALTSPTNTQIVAKGSNLDLTATATSTAGVSRVDFYANSTWLSSAAATPFTTTWTNVPAGIHILSARATNAIGQVGSSADVLIRVRGPFGGSAAAVPGWVEAEKFDLGGQDLGYNETTAPNEGNKYRTSESVDIAADAVASNGFTVGWTKAGEWMSYGLNVPESRTYTIRARVASMGSGGQFRILINGSDVSGALSVPNTGAWNAYQMVVRTNVYLTQGEQTMRVEMVQNGTSGFVGNFDGISLEAAGSVPPPPGSQQHAFPAGTPWLIPGLIECENYDEGGPSIAYSDSTLANEGGAYRVTNRVDIASQFVASNGHTVGWTKAGEWMEYTVKVGTAGVYSLSMRVASMGAGGQFRIEMNSADITGTVNVPNTGGWDIYQSIIITNVTLALGEQTLRVFMVQNGGHGYVGNFDVMRFVSNNPPPPTQYAYPAGTPWPMPGRIEMENYDEGGLSIAYNDSTAANEGGAYRVTNRVDIASQLVASNGHTVGWTKAGEWMEYTVAVSSSGTYTLSMRVANTGAGGRFRIEMNGQDVTGDMMVPNTGGWSTYQNVSKTDVALVQGVYTLRVAMVQNASSTYVGNFDVLSVVRVPPFDALASRVNSVKKNLSKPISIQSSQEDEQPGEAGKAVDGNLETVWQGMPGTGGWWLTLVYDPTEVINDMRIVWSGEPVGNARFFYSMDSDHWEEVAFPREEGPFSANYLWIILPDNGSANPPAISEIIVE